MRCKKVGMVPDTFLYFGMYGRSEMGEGLERFLKREWGVFPIFRQRKSEMPILLPAFWCDVEPAFCGEMLVRFGLALWIELELQTSLSIAFPITGIELSHQFDVIFKSIECLVEK